MAIHVRVICTENGIVIGSHSRGGRAFRKEHRVDIRPVKSAVTYAIALHEIGHILGPWQSRSRIDSECGAWLWAHENALVWTKPMETKMQRSLRSYVNWARRHKTATKPDCSHPIMEMAGLCPAAP
jgi:hypothetical protein